jgi:N-methylhydantoinase A
MPPSLRIGVDIGGTFTDLVLETGDGRRLARKVSSTPDRPESAVLAGIAALLDAAGAQPVEVAAVVHGTTVASNAILQKQGARVALVTTAGFRDVLEIGRLRTPGMFDLTWQKPAPLVPRHRRFEVRERIAADGTVVVPLDEAGLRALAPAIAATGAETLAVCLINSYRNPAHELRAAAILAEALPGVPVTASVAILPEQREYERSSTAAVNAYVLPVLRNYLDALVQGLRAAGIAAPLFVANSNGGLAPVEAARRRPVMFVSSGRAAGATGAADVARRAGMADLIAFDMGGTTASAALVRGGRLVRTSEYEFRDGISTPSRFIKAGGYLMRVPAVDVAEIGNGAGSIARVDEGGLIHVGPRSAGARPGPACYPEGGDLPTLTDANLVLGYLPDRLAGGTLRLSVERAAAAIEAHVARKAGLGLDRAALGMRAIANANMARAIRAVTIERGQDPRDVALLAFGGAGPGHACDLARSIGIPRVVLPPGPGVFTATGMLDADLEAFFIRPFARPPGALDAAELRLAAAELDRAAARELAAEGLDGGAARRAFEIDLRLAGQDAEIAVPFDADAEVAPTALTAAFRAAYAETYGYLPEDRVESVNLRLRVYWPAPRRASPPPPAPAAPPTPPAPMGLRQVLFEGAAGRLPTPVYDRASIGGPIVGPAIVESDDSTCPIPPGARALPDAFGNLTVTFDG